MSLNEKINYVEFPATDIPATKRFFEAAFGWTFIDFGTDYTAFANQGLNGGFYQSDMKSQTENGAALLVFYSANLQLTLAKVINNNGVIVKPTFSFPGGSRFHFTEPSGNEFAVWSDK